MNYTIRENYRDDTALRNAFFDFTRTVFPGIGFEEWFSRGFWLGDYIPFSVVVDTKIVPMFP